MTVDDSTNLDGCNYTVVKNPDGTYVIMHLTSTGLVRDSENLPREALSWIAVAIEKWLNEPSPKLTVV